MLKLPAEKKTAQCGEELRGALRSRMAEIGMLPSVAVQALEMIRDPECSIRDFAHVVERDVKLAFEVMRLANSSMYGFDAPVASFEEAVFRLGFRQCRNLIIASSFSTLMKNADLQEAWIREMIWRHSYQTAVLGVYLNRELRLDFQGEEFTASLLHDFGRVLLARLLPDDFASFDPLTFDEDEDVVSREREIIGTDHAELGAWYAADNALPEPLVAAVRWHHDPASADKYGPLVELVAAADHMANFIQRNGQADGYDAGENGPLQMLLRESRKELPASTAIELMNRAVADVEQCGR